MEDPNEALFLIGELCKEALDEDEQRFGKKAFASEVLSIVTDVPEATPKKAKKEK